MGRNELIEQMVTTWEALHSRGQAASIDELCRDHPELAEALMNALSRRGEPDGRRTETFDLGPARALDLEATGDVLETTGELGEHTQLGPYQIVKLIAEGGMGAVYEAVDHQLGRSVALKVMRPDVARAEKARTRFLREARAAAVLEHDHIVVIYEVGEHQGIPYLAMQLLHGNTLNERLHLSPPLTNAEVLRIGREIAEGLAVAHAGGLVHRDIKPANIWLEEGTGRVKILDFGLARAVNETARLTQDGSILGTPAFMSPEQASNTGELDHRSDLFSLGSVLYRMVTGRLAFPAESLAELFLALVRDHPIPPRQLNPSISPALDELIMGLLAKDPMARPQSARAVVEAIRRLERELTSGPAPWGGVDLDVQVEEADALLPRAPKRFPVALAAFVVFAALATGAALLLPRIFDVAGNMGELSLDAPASAVAVSVTRGGRTVGVLDPVTRPTLRVAAGLYGLELADTTGTLVLVRSEIDVARGTRQVVSLVPNVPAAMARNRAAAVMAAFEQTPDRAAMARIIASAASLEGVLEKLTERAAGDGQFQAELARYFAEQGKLTLADTSRSKAIALFEGTLAKEPENFKVAAELADLLLEARAPEWTVLRPIEMKSEGGATLTLQQDGSILASGENPEHDTYVITADTGLAAIDSFRLELIPDPSLPMGGSGRAPGNGNFSLSEWRVSAQSRSARGDPVDVRWKTALSDHKVDPAQHYAGQSISIKNAIDAEPATFWEVWPTGGKPHWAIFVPTEPIVREGGVRLTITLDFLNHLHHNIGCFRLSVNGDPTTLDAVQKRFAAQDVADPWAKLAVAYALNGRNAEALESFDKALKRADGYEARKAIYERAARFDNLLSALIKRLPDDPQLQLALARNAAARGKQRLAEKQPAKAQAELEKSRAMITRLLASGVDWTVLTPVEMSSETGVKLELQKDGSVFVHPDQHPRNDTYSLVFQSELKGITGLRLEVLADFRLPHGGPGWGENGNFVLNELTLQAAPAGSADKTRSIALRNATADFSQVTGGHWDVRNAVDGNSSTGWAAFPAINKDHTAVFEMAEEIGDGQVSRLTVRLNHQYHNQNHCLGRFRLSFTNDRAKLQATRTRLDLNDDEVVDLYVALGEAAAHLGQTNAAVAWFTEAFHNAVARAGKARIIAAAAPLEGVLEKLTEQVAGDGQFQVELARHFSEHGAAPAADAARKKACKSFAETLAKEPENSACAAELADLLLEIFDDEGRRAAQWTVLRPTEMKSKGDASLTLQSDGSILASGTNASGDIYTVSAANDLDRIAAVRLEALPDPSLPRMGPGRHSTGNFQLAAFRLYDPTKDGVSGPTPVPVEAACASFDYKASNADIAGTVDETLKKFWHVWGRVGQPHEAVFLVRETAANRARPLVIELRHQHYAEGINLGRFRLSVSADPAIFAHKRHGFAAAKLSDPWARLASVYWLRDEQQSLESLLKHHPSAASGIADLYAAAQDWEGAIATYHKLVTNQPADAAMLTRLATAYESAGRTREGVAHLAKASAANPEDTLLSFKVASLQAWFRQDRELAATRQRILAFARGTNDAVTARRAVRSVLVRPSTDKGELEAALTLGRTAAELGRGEDWNLLSLGLAEFRSGNDLAADQILLAAAEARPKIPTATCTAQFFRAMSLFRQGRPDQARQLATEAAAKMNPLPADEQNPLAVNGDLNNLFLWLAYKEAKAMIKFDAALPP